MNCTVTKFDRPASVPLARLFDHFFADSFPASRAAIDEGTLALDVSEDATDLIIRASLPGFTKDQIDAEVHDGVLTIKATRSDPAAPTPQSDQPAERYFRRERRTGSVGRRIALPGDVIESGARADLADGVLILRFPKSPKETPRKVAIQ